ncbi:hypothetical protein IAD21_00762 [Abditibacteriota bacterium]|nr:hypothetical protein IAD21_00762 [Abditibacteriota bacterium]
MKRIEASPGVSIWQRDLNESRIFRFVAVWFVCVPALLVMFVSAAAIVGVPITTITFVCLFTGSHLHDLWRERKAFNPALTPEQRQVEEALMRSAFDDYCYLRDCFICLMMNFEEPTEAEGPWYESNPIWWFISLWEDEWLVDSLQRLLHQVGRKARADSESIAHLHAIAGYVRKTSEKSPHSAQDVETITSFFEEVTTTLISIDHRFAKKRWPSHFQSSDEWSAFQNESIQSAVQNTPFRR